LNAFLCARLPLTFDKFHLSYFKVAIDNDKEEIESAQGSLTFGVPGEK
jgi:hypothetical protein